MYCKVPDLQNLKDQALTPLLVSCETLGELLTPLRIGSHV